MDVDTEYKEMVAITSDDAQRWGCPECGFDACPSGVRPTSQVITTCPVCNIGFMVMGSEETISSFEIGSGEGRYRPQLVEHPRKGTLKHGLEDTVPPEGGEYFRSRGLGMESSLCCFVCGASSAGYTNNISGFVTSKAGGERVVAMLTERHEGAARLDYRDWEPHYIQVKVGACNTHRSNLGALHESCTDGTISGQRILEAIG